MLKLSSLNRAFILAFSVSLALSACGGSSSSSSNNPSSIPDGGNGADDGGSGDGGNEGGNDGGSDGGGSGSGSDNGGSNDGGDETSRYQGVEGPLDVIQQPLSEQVFGGLASAAEGTPLEASISCLDQVVAQDTVDILDAVLAAVNPESAADPQQAFAAAAENVQLASNELLADLPGLLMSLAGQGDCDGSASPGGDNPLAGTPLAPLGEALAPLLNAGGGGSADGDLDLTALTILTGQLSDAFEEGLSNLPAEVMSAPVLGGALTTLSVTFADLDNTVVALDSGNGVLTAFRVSQTVEHLLKNVLTGIVPVTFIEEQAGQQGVVSDQINSGVEALSSQLLGGLAVVLAPTFDQLFGGAAAQLFAGVNTILTPLGEVLSDSVNGGGSGAGPTGTPLDALLAPLESLAAALQGGGSDGGLTGTPLDLLLDPIASALSGGGCPLEGTPLAVLCSAVDQLQSAVSQQPGADPLALLTDTLKGLLGGLIP
ncbi:hypothetical protein [Spongiibacter marinus]|uniref:hypothetical protein n=1 Tax=Spongiibacter marinus TaxID=354246 RepID=UPI0035BE92E9